LAARQLASLDQLSDGRLAVHIITGGSDEEQGRDGDFLTKDERYDRTDEYLDVLKKTWTSAGPFDHEGRYYMVKDSFAAVRPPQGRRRRLSASAPRLSAGTNRPTRETH